MDMDGNWSGLCGKSVAKAPVVFLSPSWVAKEVPVQIQQFCQDIANQGKWRWLQPLAAGTPLDLPLVIVPWSSGDFGLNPGWPVVWYRQVGNGVCATAALASALSYFGALDGNCASFAGGIAGLGHLFDSIEAGNTHTGTDLVVNSRDIMKQIAAFISRRVPGWDAHWMHPPPDPREGLAPFGIFPSLVHFEASDGDATHCLVIMGDYIFDANMPGAIPFSAENLDRCVLGTHTFLRPIRILQVIPCKRVLNAHRVRACVMEED